MLEVPCGQSLLTATYKFRVCVPQSGWLGQGLDDILIDRVLDRLIVGSYSLLVPVNSVGDAMLSKGVLDQDLAQKASRNFQ